MFFMIYYEFMNFFLSGFVRRYTAEELHAMVDLKPDKKDDE